MATHSSILAGKIPWTEEPDDSPWGLKELDTTGHTTGAEMAVREEVRKTQRKQQRGRLGARRGRSEDCSAPSRGSRHCPSRQVS